MTGPHGTAVNSDATKLQRGGAENRRSRDQEAELAGPPSPQTEQRRHADCRPAAREAWQNGQPLRESHDRRAKNAEPTPTAARPWRKCSGRKQHARHDETNADYRGVVEGRLELVLETEPDRRRRHRRGHTKPDDSQGVTPLRARLAQLAQQPAKKPTGRFREDDHDGDKRADVRADVEQEHGRAVGVKIEPPLGQGEVSAAADREKLRQPLHDSQQKRIGKAQLGHVAALSSKMWRERTR